jgi:hypothetical protein
MTFICGMCGFNATFSSQSMQSAYPEGNVVPVAYPIPPGAVPPASCPMCHQNNWRAPA